MRLDTDLHCKRGSRENELLAANCIKKKKKKEKNENRFCFLFETLFNPSLTCTLPQSTNLHYSHSRETKKVKLDNNEMKTKVSFKRNVKMFLKFGIHVWLHPLFLDNKGLQISSQNEKCFSHSFNLFCSPIIGT